MKNKFKTSTILLAALLAPFAMADKKENAQKTHGDHDHAHGEHDGHSHDAEKKNPVTKNAKKNGPNGGRLLTDISPQAEFLINGDRKVQITFLDKDGKAITSKNTVSLIGGQRNNPTKFTFVKTAHGFLSNEKLPEGKLIPVVLTLQNGEEKKKNIRFNVDLNFCKPCGFLEYACTCEHHDHGHGHDHGHDHKHDH